MRGNSDERLHQLARLRCLPGLACVLAYAAVAGSDPPRAKVPGSVIRIEETPPTRILYFEESGGIITPVATPPASSVRLPLAPFSAQGAKVPAHRPPIARTTPAPGKTRLGKTLTTLPAPAADASVAATAGSAIRTEEEMRLDRRREYDALVATLSVEQLPSAERARRFDEVAGPLVVSYRDATAALRLAWLWLDGKNPASAGVWFQRARAWRSGDAEATRGLAIATLAERNYTSALALADELPASLPLRTEVRRDALIGIGQGEYRVERYGRALAAFNSAEAAGELPRYARMLRAWTLLSMGDMAAAAAEFARLYREAPDRESAQGIVAAVPVGPLPVDAVVATTEPLVSLMRVRDGEAAFRARRYLEARALDPSRWGDLGSPGVTAALAGVGRREKTGEAGLARLTAEVAPGADVSIPLGTRAAVSLSTVRLRLDAGVMDPDATVGSAPVRGTRVGARQVRSTVRESHVSLRMEDHLAITTTVGDGVKGGAVSARRIGSIDAEATPGWGQAGVRAFVEPVRESILSWAGMTDPYGGSSWGGVRRIGAEIRALYLGAAPYSAGIRARAERLAGTQVAGNERRAFDASVGRDLGLQGFAYSSLGIAVGFDAYDRNLSHYTVGHGGYFSPQSYRKAGLAFDFMTEERKSWLVRGRASTARTWKSEDAAPLFPLDPDGRIYGSSRSTGHDGAMRISAVAQVSPYVQVGATIGRGISPQWSEKSASLEFRVLFAPRRGVVSADLPVVRGD